MTMSIEYNKFTLRAITDTISQGIAYILSMNTHQAIDRRGIILAKAIAQHIDNDAELKGLAHAREVCAHWLKSSNSSAIAEWHVLLQNPWTTIREILLEESEEGNRLRQSSPFCGILSPRERWDIFKQARLSEQTSA